MAIHVETAGPTLGSSNVPLSTGRARGWVTPAPREYVKSRSRLRVLLRQVVERYSWIWNRYSGEVCMAGDILESMLLVCELGEPPFVRRPLVRVVRAGIFIDTPLTETRQNAGPLPRSNVLGNGAFSSKDFPRHMPSGSFSDLDVRIISTLGIDNVSVATPGSGIQIQINSRFSEHQRHVDGHEGAGVLRPLQETVHGGASVNRLEARAVPPFERQHGVHAGPVTRRKIITGGTAGAAAMIMGIPRLAYAENGVTDNMIRVGQSAVFSGPAKDFGVDYRAGLQICFRHINKGGGVNGRRIELISYDDAYEPAKTAVNTAKLIDEDKVFALIGYVATGNLTAAMPLVDKAGVPMFAPLVGTTSFRNVFNRNLFHVRAGYDLELRKIISHLSTIGIRSIAIVFQDSAFGKSNLATCERLALEYKVQVLKTLPMAISATDAKEISAALTDAKPGAVVMVMAGRMVEVFIHDYRTGGVASPLYTLSVGITDAAGSADRLQGKLAGVVTASIVPPPSSLAVPIVAEYQRDRAEAGEEINSYTSLEGYIVARVFVEGLRRAGRVTTRDSFIAAMETIGNARIGEFPVSYGPSNHNGSTFVDLEMYKRDGKLQR